MFNSIAMIRNSSLSKLRSITIPLLSEAVYVITSDTSIECSWVMLQKSVDSTPVSVWGFTEAGTFWPSGLYLPDPQAQPTFLQGPFKLSDLRIETYDDDGGTLLVNYGEL